MPYQTGVAADFANLVATIKTFAGNNGWSVSGDVIYKGDVYAAVKDEFPVVTDRPTTGLSVQGGLGTSGGALTDPATYKSMLRQEPLQGDLTNSFPVTYHLFCHTSPDQITLFINYNSVWWQWMTFGEMEKYGSYTGGQFYAASTNYSATIDNSNVDKITIMGELRASGVADWMPSGVAPFWGGYSSSDYPDGSTMHLELDGNTWWLSCRSLVFNSNRVNTPSFMTPLLGRTNATWSEITTLLPYYVWAIRPSAKASLLGRIAHFRLLRIDNYSPGDIITIGSDRYKVFPFLRKTNEDEGHMSNTSGVWGVAVVYDGP